MASTYCQLDPLLPADGVWAVPVPWHLVPLLARCREVRQLAATGYADPATRRAALILWPGVDPRCVVALLERLDRSYQARRSDTPRVNRERSQPHRPSKAAPTSEARSKLRATWRAPPSERPRAVRHRVAVAC